MDLSLSLFKKLKDISMYPVYMSRFDNGWFDKPKAVHQCLLTHSYNKVCWLDNDIEVLQNIDDIFEQSHYEIAGVPDFLYPFCLNAGVLVFNRASIKLVDEWQQLTDTRLFRSDQEALQNLRELEPNKFGELPMIYNHQKWAIENGLHPCDSTRVLHWTGETGKTILRDKLGLSSGPNV